MGKLLKIIAVIAILIIIPKAIQKVMGLDDKSQTKKQVTELVTSLNASLPKEVGPGITLTKVEFDNNVLRNNYSVDPEAKFRLAQKPLYENNAFLQVCKGHMALLSKKGITVEFRYKYSESGEEKTLDISVPPNSCT